MTQTGRVGLTVRFGVLPVVMFAVLLSGIACDDGQPVVVEPSPALLPVHKLPGPEAFRRTLTTCAPRVHESVKWSPDGAEVLFIVGPDVYGIGTDGGGLRKVAHGFAGGKAAKMTAFDVSAGGRRILYSRCHRPGGDAPGYEHQLVIGSLGDTKPLLTKDDDFHHYPAWSPDGERIVFLEGQLTDSADGSDWAERLSIYTMAADGTSQSREAVGVAHYPPRWSPDGERIAYVAKDDDARQAIYVVPADGYSVERDQQRLTDAVSGPSWSPDGQRIAFAKPAGNEMGLYTIDRFGTDARRLGTIEGWQPRYGVPKPARAWIRLVSWSPDGSRIMVIADQGSAKVQIVAVDGSGSSWVTFSQPIVRSIEHAAWSPDGTRIAIVGDFGTDGSHEPAKSIALLTIGGDGADLRVLVGIQEDGRLEGLGVVRGDISAEVAACGEGVAVPDPEANPGLVEDCKTLLEVQNPLAGPGGLNWSADKRISEWEGVVVRGTPQRVWELTLTSRGLTGEIPTEVSRLTELRVLDVSDNGLTGEIPAELGELQNLEKLLLNENYLSGEIPAELGGLLELSHLSLGINNLSGGIPPELGQLANLKWLGLIGNRLTGAIPVELGRLTELEHLDLADNELTDSIPAELGQLVGLVRLRLDSNLFTGEIPPELERLMSLEHLDLSDNNLSGAIPAGLGQLADLTKLNLRGNQFTGCLPAGLREISDSDVGRIRLPDCE